MKQALLALAVASLIALGFTRYMERHQADAELVRIHREMAYGRRS